MQKNTQKNKKQIHYEVLEESTGEFIYNLEIEKTTRSFRYDLSQIPYDYSVKVTNRFKGLDLIDRVPEELWTEVCNAKIGRAHV